MAVLKFSKHKYGTVTSWQSLQKTPSMFLFYGRFKLMPIYFVWALNKGNVMQIIRSMGMFHFLLLCSCVMSFSGMDLLRAEDTQESVYEIPPLLKRESFVHGSNIKGSYYSIAKGVSVENFYAVFRVQSKIFGTSYIKSKALLKIRIQEIETLAWASEIRGGETALDSLEESVSQIPLAAKNTVLHPVASAKKIGQGVKHKVNRIMKGIKWRKKTEYEDTLVKSILLSGEKRRLAHELKLDPYSSNPHVHQLLDRLAKARFAGKIPMKLVGMVLPTYASWTLTALKIRATVSRDLRDKTAPELRSQNNAYLEKMGISEAERLTFLENKKLSPRHKTAIITALQEMKDVTSVGSFIFSVRKIRDEADALFAERQAEMLAYYHKEVEPLYALRVCGDVPVGITRSDRNVVLLLPLDYLHWSKELSAMIAPIGEDLFLRDIPVKTVFVTGHISSLAKKKILRHGFSVRAGRVGSLPSPSPGVIPLSRKDANQGSLVMINE